MRHRQRHQDDGDVTAANFPAVQSALCNLTYVHSSVTNAICQWVQDLGAQNIMQAQQTGVLADYTCVCTGTPGILPYSGYLPPSRPLGHRSRVNRRGAGSRPIARHIRSGLRQHAYFDSWDR